MHKNFGVKTFQAEDEIAAIVCGYWRIVYRASGTYGHERTGTCLEIRSDWGLP